MCAWNANKDRTKYINTKLVSHLKGKPQQKEKRKKGGLNKRTPPPLHKNISRALELREDTHKKVFFNGRTTKRVGGKPPEPLFQGVYPLSVF